jgi:V8-like Glu-specific endopeptidase
MGRQPARLTRKPEAGAVVRGGSNHNASRMERLRLNSVAFLAAVVVALLGCSAPMGGSNDADIGGGKVENGRPSVGMLRVGTGAGACTGTLIAPDVVLTAAHCVAEPLSAFYLGNGVAENGRGREAFLAMRGIRVVRTEHHESWGPWSPLEGSDIALVWLAERVTDVTPSPVNRRAPTVGEYAISVGFGYDENGYVHRKRSARERITAVKELDVQANAVTGHTGGGDSGGPLFFGDTIVAVNSSGDEPDILERVDVVLSWLQQRVPELTTVNAPPSTR